MYEFRENRNTQSCSCLLAVKATYSCTVKQLTHVQIQNALMWSVKYVTDCTIQALALSQLLR